jgi:hypothetical protein
MPTVSACARDVSGVQQRQVLLLYNVKSADADAELSRKGNNNNGEWSEPLIQPKKESTAVNNKGALQWLDIFVYLFLYLHRTQSLGMDKRHLRHPGKIKVSLSHFMKTGLLSANAELS